MDSSARCRAAARRSANCSGVSDVLVVCAKLALARANAMTAVPIVTLVLMLVFIVCALMVAGARTRHDARHGITPELSDSRRQGRWSARGASELPAGFERRSGAAVRSSDLVSPCHRFLLLSLNSSITALVCEPATFALARRELSTGENTPLV